MFTKKLSNTYFLTFVLIKHTKWNWALFKSHETLWNPIENVGSLLFFMKNVHNYPQTTLTFPINAFRVTGGVGEHLSVSSSLRHFQIFGGKFQFNTQQHLQSFHFKQSIVYLVFLNISFYFLSPRFIYFHVGCWVECTRFSPLSSLKYNGHFLIVWGRLLSNWIDLTKMTTFASWKSSSLPPNIKQDHQDRRVQLLIMYVAPGRLVLGTLLQKKNFFSTLNW